MQKDLFGNNVDSRDTFEKELSEFDRISFNGRLIRFRYFYDHFPEMENIIFGSDESYRIFYEVRSCFINGEFIAVIVLSQSFIERRFQESLKMNGFENESKYTLDKILKQFKGKSSIPDYFIDMVDSLRLKRNPFIHLRHVLDSNNLFSRSYLKNKNADLVLEKDAKDAITLMLESLRIRVL